MRHRSYRNTPAGRDRLLVVWDSASNARTSDRDYLLLRPQFETGHGGTRSQVEFHGQPTPILRPQQPQHDQQVVRVEVRGELRQRVCHRIR